MKLFSLNRPARSNQYCGPAVLSFLTGQDTSECASWFRRFGNHRGAVRGSYERDMRLVSCDKFVFCIGELFRTKLNERGKQGSKST